jgi:peptidoglycan glycosyltransferase
MTAEESSYLRELMIEVVENGTASRLSSYGYTAGGKTGSAEYNSNKSDSHAWFTGFAPAQDPEIAFTIIVEGVGSGGDYAVPMIRRILDTYFN